MKEILGDSKKLSNPVTKSNVTNPISHQHSCNGGGSSSGKRENNKYRDFRRKLRYDFFR